MKFPEFFFFIYWKERLAGFDCVVNTICLAAVFWWTMTYFHK